MNKLSKLDRPRGAFKSGGRLGSRNAQFRPIVDEFVVFRGDPRPLYAAKVRNVSRPGSPSSSGPRISALSKTRLADEVSLYSHASPGWYRAELHCAAKFDSMAEGMRQTIFGPRTAAPQTHPIKQVQAGQVRFMAQCGFCHGRDAAGGETGPDLTRSELVAEDLGGDKIGPLLHSGRPQQGMPAFDLRRGGGHDRRFRP